MENFNYQGLEGQYWILSHTGSQWFKKPGPD